MHWTGRRAHVPSAGQDGRAGAPLHQGGLAVKVIIRALIGLLAQSVCLVLAAPSAAARTTPAPLGAVTAAARAAATPDLPA